MRVEHTQDVAKMPRAGFEVGPQPLLLAVTDSKYGPLITAGDRYLPVVTAQMWTKYAQGNEVEGGPEDPRYIDDRDRPCAEVPDFRFIG